MCNECTWHHKTVLVQSVYWHLAIKLYYWTAGCRSSSEPRSGQKREVELGSPTELDCLLLQVSTAGPSDSCLCNSVPSSCCVSLEGASCHKYHFCRDKRFVVTNTCLSRLKMSSVATKACLSRQTYFCRDKTLVFVATNTSRTTQKEKPDRATTKQKNVIYPPPPWTTQKKILTNQNKSYIYPQSNTEEKPGEAKNITYLPPEQHRRQYRLLAPSVRCPQIVWGCVCTCACTHTHTHTHLSLIHISEPTRPP